MGLLTFIFGCIMALIGLGLMIFSEAKEKVLGFAVALFALLIIGVSMYVGIGAGEVGVLFNPFNNGVQTNEIHEGANFIVPWIAVVGYDIKTVKVEEDTEVLSNEGLKVGLHLTAQYRIDGVRANEIHQTIGVGFEEIAIKPQIRSIVREVIAQYPAIDLYTDNRAKIEAQVFEQVKLKLAERGIILESVLFRNVVLPAQLTTSIEQKKQAEQESLKMEYILLKEKQEADRKRIEAQGISDANNIIAGSLTPAYLNWYWISNLDKYQSVAYIPIGNNGMPSFQLVKDVDIKAA